MARPKNEIPTLPLTVHLPVTTLNKMMAEITGGMSEPMPFGGNKAFIDYALNKVLKNKAACKKFHELQKGKQNGTAKRGNPHKTADSTPAS